MAKVLRKQQMDDLISLLTRAGKTVFAPVSYADGMSQFAQVENADAIDFDMILPKMSIKELFFPRTEVLMEFDIAKHAVDLYNVVPPDGERVVFGVRPCDAASLAVLDPLFNWDSQDPYWNIRRECTTVVAAACTSKDEFCMCTSLGLAPDATVGADLLVRPLANEDAWQVEPVTDKGLRLLDGIDELLTDEESIELAPVAQVEKRFDTGQVNAWLKRDTNFDGDFWREISMRCVGCGVCTYLCPTCYCFDIQDQGDIYHGVRCRNWDSCSFALFTRHASGHNPRSTRAARWRQRIMHKFNYYPARFGYFGCTGCGRCTRHCPVDMGITATLLAIC